MWAPSPVLKYPSKKKGLLPEQTRSPEALDQGLLPSHGWERRLAAAHPQLRLRVRNEGSPQQAVLAHC